MSSSQMVAVTINTANVTDMLEFYSTLGLEFVAKKVNMGSTIHKAQAGAIELTLYAIKAKNLELIPPIQLAFQVEDLAKVFSKISHLMTCSVILDPVSLPDGIRAVVLDPDGHSVELVQWVQL